jgi:hypothetical protein
LELFGGLGLDATPGSFIISSILASNIGGVFMLSEFDQAKRELQDIRDELMRLQKSDDSKIATPQIAFLKSRTRDLLRDIYPDSKATLEHIENALKKDHSISAALAIINSALKLTPPLRRSLSSEEDGRTVEALVEAAAWRSKLFRYVGGGSVVLLVLFLGLLGINISDVHNQADGLRKSLSEAKTSAQEAEKAAKEIDVYRANIAAISARLSDPNGEAKQVIARFDKELSHLNDLERDWASRREALVANLVQHDTFLIGKESEVARKTADFNQQVEQQISSINAAAKDAVAQQANVASLASASKGNADAVEANLKSAKANAEQLKALLDGAAELSKSAAATSKEIEKTQREVEGARSRLAAIQQEAENSKQAIDSAAQSATADQSKFSKSLAALQRQADERIETLQLLVTSTNNRSNEIIRVADQVTTLKSDIIRTIEDLTTKEQRLKGNLDRLDLRLGAAVEIVKVLDDKRSDILQQLHALLDQRPNLDSAAVWKLILADNILRWLLIGVSAFVLFFAGWLLVVGWRVRRLMQKFA